LQFTLYRKFDAENNAFKMRIDQYLWFVRIFKTRSLATNCCRKGLVKMSGKTVKPSVKIYPKRIIEVRKNQFWYKLEVVNIPKSRLGAKEVGLHCIFHTTPEDDEIRQKQRLDFSPFRERGAGRPTKKERREIDALPNN